MQLNHVHVGVRDLKAAVEWLERVWNVCPAFQNERMAMMSFGSFNLIVDAGSHDTVATIGFESEDCDRDFQNVVSLGAAALQPPADQPWGARTAYLRGPGNLKFEIEGPLKDSTSH